MPDDEGYAELKGRIERLESQLAFLFRSLGINDSDAPAWKPSPRVLDLIKQGRKNEAIKALREESGASLKGAKNFIDGLEAKKTL